MSFRHLLCAVAVLWLAGNALRLTILAVPPILPLIQADLHLSGTDIGILSGLPMALFAIAALPGALLIARFGALQTLVIGLLLTAAGSAARSFATTAVLLFAATIAMSAGVAVMQPALPALVRRWLPDRIGFGTAVYTNGLLVGETFPAALMIPVVLPLVGESWRAGLFVWAIPPAVIAILAVLLAPRSEASGGPNTSGPVRWWPDWNNSLIWRLGLIFGAVNSFYFGANAFLPAHLTAGGRVDLISPALSALNLGQIPASLMLLAWARRVERRIWPFVLSGLLAIGSLIGIALTASGWTVGFAAALGFAGAVALALGLTLPPFLAPPEDVARMSAAMFTLSYGGAVIVSVVSGAIWDFTGDVRFAFLPLAIAALPLVVLTPTIRFERPLAGP